MKRRIRIAVVSLSLLMLLVLAVNPTPVGAAAFPGENGRIAFQSNRSGRWEIYTMRGDGSDETRLTGNGAYNGQPAFSPDGRKIAFIRDSGPSANPVGRFGSLWIMNSDGSDQRQLTDRQSAHPAFSPDGKRITFSSVSDSGCAFGISWANIFVISISSGGIQKLTKVCDPAFNPSFSPDGSEVLFQGKSFRESPFGADSVLWVDSNRTQPDSSPGLVVALLPTQQIKGFSLGSDGKQWAYSLRQGGEPEIFASKAGGPCGKCAASMFGGGGREADKLTSFFIDRQRPDDVRPSFAPEGDWVAFERRPDDPNTQIYKASKPPYVQTRQIKQLTVTGRNMAPNWGPRTP